MVHTPNGLCVVVLCFVLRWSATAAARLSSAATNLEPVEQEINPSFADVDTYHTCELSEGNYTMSNLSEIWCNSGNSGKRLKDIIEMHPNSSTKLVLAPTKPVRLVGKGDQQTKLEFEISLLPGASLSLEALHFQGKIEVLQNETSTDQSKMSYLTFVNCSVEPPAGDQKQLTILELDGGIQDPSASAWRGWLMVRDAALTLEIHGSDLHGGAFVKQSRNFNLLASKSFFDLEGQGFQLVNVTSHLQLEKVEVHARRDGQLYNHPSFHTVLGRHKVHVAGSTFEGSAIQIKDPVDLTLNVSKSRFFFGPRAIEVAAGNEAQVDLQHVKIHGFSEVGVFIFLWSDLANVKLDNIQIEHTGVGADIHAKHLIAKNVDIWHTETGIQLDRVKLAKLEAVKMIHVGTGLKALYTENLSAEDLEISEAKITAIELWNSPSRVNGVSISYCSVAVKRNRCDSLSMDDVLIAGNVQALESGDGKNLQMSSGLVFFNSWRDTLAINQGKGANVLVWSRLPCPIAIAFSCLACGLATILSRIGLEQHFSGGFETASYGQTRKYVSAGASLLLWIMVLEAVVAAFLLRAMSWKYAHQERVHVEIVKNYATIWLASLLALLTAAIIYLYITVVRRRLDIKTLADLKRTEMLLQQKDGLKASLDNVELREEMDRIQMQMFLAKTTGDQAKVQETFDEMKSKAEEEASRLADWYAERRACYASEDAGARLKALEGIPSQILAEAVQLPLPTTDESESLDMLCATASWLRSNFKDHLMKVCSDLNGINSRADLQNLGYDEMQFDPATHPLQPEANASIGKHVGLLVAPVKSKDRAQAKVMTDYKEDQAAGKKSELPLARYVCDFLRATIFASDPYVLAVAFWQLQKEFEFVRVKNKFGEEGLRPELRTNILVNLWVKHGDCALIGEVQFLLQDYLTAKSLQHLYYDVARAASPEELWGKPIFR